MLRNLTLFIKMTPALLPPGDINAGDRFYIKKHIFLSYFKGAGTKNPKPRTLRKAQSPSRTYGAGKM